MDTAGSVLKTEREKQGKSLDEIAQALKLNIEYLKAIENEQYNLIPAEIYTRAYLRFYAQALGLDTTYIIDLYQKQIDASSSRKPVLPKKEFVLPYKPALAIASLVLIAFLIIILAKHRGAQPGPEAARETKKPQISESAEEIKTKEQVREAIKEPGASDLKTTEIKEEAHDAKETGIKIQDQELPALQERKELSLVITAKEPTWVSVRIDGSGPKDWLMKKGEEISLSASERFVIKTGNAGGTNIVFNGKDVGELGPLGMVLELTLPKDGNE